MLAGQATKPVQSLVSSFIKSRYDICMGVIMIKGNVCELSDPTPGTQEGSFLLLW